MITTNNGGVYEVNQTRAVVIIKEVRHGENRDRTTGRKNQDTGGSRGDRASS